MKALVTGASGFIGRALVDELISHGYEVIGIGRHPSAEHNNEQLSGWLTHDLTGPDGLFPKIGQVDVVYHLAGRAHILRGAGAGSDAAFHTVNVLGTEKLAIEAGDAGVGRFVFVSTIGVHQGELRAGRVVNECSPLTPDGPYAVSKLDAERRLRRVCDASGMEVCIVRPVLVVGGGVPGNLARLAALAAKEYPVPIPRRKHVRSFVALSNLVDLLILCGERTTAAGQVFIAADEPWISTKQAFEWIAEGMGKRARLLSVNSRLLAMAFAVVGKSDIFHKLFDDQRVDAGKARRILEWRAREPLREAFLRLGHQYG